jgi:AmiR/NasT family two-component response regulator
MKMPNERVLLVEDEAVVAMDLVSRLEQIGHVVVGSLRRAEEALEAARRLEPTVVLMDIRTPGAVDGIDAAGQIHEQLGIPVIYTTAYADKKTLGRAKGTLPFGYLIKPVDTRALESTIEMAAHYERELRALNDSLSQRVNELSSLNRLFQDHMNESYAVMDAYESLRRKLTSHADQISSLVKEAHQVDIPRAPQSDGSTTKEA